MDTMKTENSLKNTILKLDWKKKWLSDKSGYWYSAKVPTVGWEYIVETHYTGDILAGIYLSKLDDDVTKISKRKFKTEQQAMVSCEEHLQQTFEKFQAFIKNL